MGRGTFEIEIKYRLKDPRALEARLRRLGARRLGRDAEKNVLYDHPALKLRERGRALRIRETGKPPALLTYKGPATRGPIKKRLEIETRVEAKTLGAILEHLGFEPRLRYDKTRVTYRLGRCLVTVDRLKGHGTFSEIEGPRSAILVLEKRLGFAPADREDRTYAQIVTGRPWR